MTARAAAGSTAAATRTHQAFTACGSVVFAAELCSFGTRCPSSRVHSLRDQLQVPNGGAVPDSPCRHTYHAGLLLPRRSRTTGTMTQAETATDSYVNGH